MSQLKLKIFEIVNRIPVGKVAFYGQIATVSTQEGLPVRAQVVGWILSGMKMSEFDECPWWRVVAKNGFVASLKLGAKGILQLEMLGRENIEIEKDVVNMKDFGVTLEQISDSDNFFGMKNLL